MLSNITSFSDDHWTLLKQLSIDQIKILTRRVKDERVIASQYVQICNWLSSKDKMINILGSAMVIEPSMLLNQLDQVQVT